MAESVRARPRVAIKSGVVVALGGAWILAFSRSWNGPASPRSFTDLGLTAAAVAAAALCVVRARREAGRHRLVWALIGLSATSWAIGQAISTWYAVVQGRDLPFPSFADGGYLAAVPPAAAALLLLPTGVPTVAGRLRTLFDGAMIAVSALLAGWVFVLRTVGRRDGGLLPHAVSVLYPIGGVIVVTIVFSVVLRTRHGGARPSRPLLLVGAGLLATAFSDSTFAYLTDTGSHAPGGVVDIGRFCGYLLVLLAALQAQPIMPQRRDEVVEAGLLDRLLPSLAVGVAVGATSVELVRTGSDTSFVYWLQTSIIVGIVVRQILTLRENRTLTRRLEARLDDLRASEQRFEALVQHSSDVVTVVDRDGTITYQSESILRVFGHSGEDVVGASVAGLCEPRSGERLLAAIEELASRPEGNRVIELELRHATGRLCHAEMTMTNLLANRSVGGIVLNTRDISERKVLQDQLVHEASHDSLTTLANRSLFRDRVESVLRRAEAREEDGLRAKLTVLFLDLDGFKEVNDSLGHAMGDVLLVQVAERLRSCVRPIDTVARLGGDEFAVLIADQSSERAGAAVADRIMTALREPFKLQGREIYVGASIGIAATDEDVDDADHLLRNADLAMYRAKATGAGGFERYHPRLHLALVERLQLESDLRQALANDELELHYQPTLALATGEITGLEALARWKHQQQGYVPPSEFVPLAEQTGLVRRLGCFGLREACRQLVEWRDQLPGCGELTMSVNISGRHLDDAALIDDVRDALVGAGLEPRRLVLEMTESVLMDHTDANVELLARLKELGVRLAIDDFGTGYSSLAYLHRFPADVIKIDRSFVERLGRSESETELLRTIVQLGQSLRMVTVAEGVETEEQVHALRAMGCELAQGFHFHRPLPAEAARQLLATASTAGRRAA